MHEHVHVDGAGVQLFGPQEVEDGGEQRGVSVNEDCSSFILQSGDPPAQQTGEEGVRNPGERLSGGAEPLPSDVQVDDVTAPRGVGHHLKGYKTTPITIVFYYFNPFLGDKFRLRFLFSSQLPVTQGGEMARGKTRGSASIKRGGAKLRTRFWDWNRTLIQRYSISTRKMKPVLQI